MRVEIETGHGSVTGFVVQYEAWIDGEYRPVVRYDMAHGFAHCDVMRPDGSQKSKTPLNLPASEAISYAMRDIHENWERYRRAFESELRGGK